MIHTYFSTHFCSASTSSTPPTFPWSQANDRGGIDNGCHESTTQGSCATATPSEGTLGSSRISGVESEVMEVPSDGMFFYVKRFFFFANQVIMSLKFWGSLVCFFLVVLGFGLWIYEGLQNQKLESCSSISRCLPQGFLRLVLLSLHSCESGEPAFWHVGQVGYPSGTTWLAACTPCFFSLRFSHVFRQVWAAWMSPSHDGYVGPKAISKRTVPLGLMFRCDEGSCFTSTRS